MHVCASRDSARAQGCWWSGLDRSETAANCSLCCVCSLFFFMRLFSSFLLITCSICVFGLSDSVSHYVRDSCRYRTESPANSCANAFCSTQVFEAFDSLFERLPRFDEWEHWVQKCMTGEYRLNVEGLKATDEFKNVSLEVLRRPKRAALVSAVSLPGYTGWKRKEGFEVLTQKFRLVMQSDAVVGELVRWSIVPATAVPENHHGLFYTRFSGPEISSSVVDEHYNFSSVFQTEGLYTLEVILQFVLRDSFTAAFNVSLQDRFAYPYIGGHILNSPFSFKATAATPARVNASGSCTLSDYRNQTQNGYWSVLKVPRLVPAFGQPESVCIRHGLRKENHSLCVFCDCHPDAFFEGLVLDWKPECQLTQYDRIIPGHYHPWSKDYETSVPTYSFLHTLKAKVIFIGDSTLRLQHDAMLAHLSLDNRKRASLVVATVCCSKSRERGDRKGGGRVRG